MGCVADTRVSPSGKAADAVPDSARLSLSESGTHSCQPGGSGCQLGSGCQPGGGDHPGGSGGHPGGGLNRFINPPSPGVSHPTPGSPVCTALISRAADWVNWHRGFPNGVRRAGATPVMQAPSPQLGPPAGLACPGRVVGSTGECPVVGG